MLPHTRLILDALRNVFLLLRCLQIELQRLATGWHNLIEYNPYGPLSLLSVNDIQSKGLKFLFQPRYIKF